MRLIIGIDEDGHSFAVNVDTFSKLKTYILNHIEEYMGHYYPYKSILDKINAHDTSEDILKDDYLMEELYHKGIVRGSPLKYDNLKLHCISNVEERLDPFGELIGRVQSAKNEDEILDNDEIMDELYDLRTFGGGRDLFVALYDPEQK